MSSVEEMNYHLSVTFSDSAREQDLSPFEKLIKPPEPAAKFNISGPTLKVLKDVVMAAR